MFWYSFGDETSVTINAESINPSFSIISVSKPRLFSHHDSLISVAPLRLIESLNCLIFWSFGNDTIRLEFSFSYSSSLVSKFECSFMDNLRRTQRLSFKFRNCSFISTQ